MRYDYESFELIKWRIQNYEKEKTFLPYSYMICIWQDRTVENMAAKFVPLWTYFHENYTL